MPTFKAIAQKAPRTISVIQGAAAGTFPSAFCFVNPTGSGEYFRIVEVNYIYDVASTGGTHVVEICASGTALGSGTEIANFVSTSAARTPRQVSGVNTLTTTTVKPGDSICLVNGGTLTNLASMVVNIVLQPITVKRTH